MNKLSIKKIFVLLIVGAVLSGGLVMTFYKVFAIQGTRHLSVQLSPDNGGRVIGKTDYGSKIIDCGINSNDVCDADIVNGNVKVTIQIQEITDGYRFSSWGGACSGNPRDQNYCVLIWSAGDTSDKTVTVNFTSLPNNLNVILQSDDGANSSAGIVKTTNASANVQNINCGMGNTQCSTLLLFKDNITLKSAAANYYQFSKWSGNGIASNCDGQTNLTCKVLNDQSDTATGTLIANFIRSERYIEVTPTINLKANSGGGLISGSEDNGTKITKIINCGTDSNNSLQTQCKSGIDYGTVTVTLTSTPASGYQFSGWGGDCSGTSPDQNCVLNWTEGDTYHRYVTANFISQQQQPTPPPPSQYNLQVALGYYDNSGHIVTSSVVGTITTVTSSEGVTSINCGYGIAPQQCGTYLTAGYDIHIGRGNTTQYISPQSITLSVSTSSGYTFDYWKWEQVTGTPEPESSCNGVTSTVCQFTQSNSAQGPNDGASGTLTAIFKVISPKLEGSATASLVYVSSSASVATVYVSWPAVKDDYFGGSYIVKRINVDTGSSTVVTTTQNTYFYDTEAPLNTTPSYSISFKSNNSLVSSTQEITSNPVNLNIKNRLVGYAWANIGETTTTGSFIATSPDNNLFSVTGTALVDKVTMTINIKDSSSCDLWNAEINGSSLDNKHSVDVISQPISGSSSYTWTDKQNLNSDTIYTYKIQVECEGNNGTVTSSQNFQAHTGQATYQGIGWVKFSSNTGPTDSNSYGVYIDSNNNLVGYAWSDYGWLSFNPSDLDATHTQAKIDQNGTLSGYARFLAFKDGNSSWDGYVPLNGILYDASTGHFTGKTPLPLISILGQMSFCDSNNPQNPLYCVKTQSTFNAPQITSLKSISPTSIEVKWINPQDYKEVEIWVSNDNDPYNFPFYESPKTYLDSSPETTRCGDAQNRNETCGTPKEYTAIVSNGIHPGTLYGVKVRGRLK